MTYLNSLLSPQNHLIEKSKLTNCVKNIDTKCQKIPNVPIGVTVLIYTSDWKEFYLFCLFCFSWINDEEVGLRILLNPIPNSIFFRHVEKEFGMWKPNCFKTANYTMEKLYYYMGPEQVHTHTWNIEKSCGY